MSSYLSLARIRDSVIRLFDWRGQVKQQTTAHMFPLLALLERGAGSKQPTQFEEAYDFEFFDRYFAVGSDAKMPYFDPLSRTFRIKSHPHSNIATARKGTFAASWGAAKLEARENQALYSLSDDYAAIVATNVMQKGGNVQRMSVIDAAVWLFRSEDFGDDADAASLLERFRARFPMSDADFEQLFEYREEPAANLFVKVKPLAKDVDAAIAALALRRVAAPIPAPEMPAVPPEASGVLDDDDPILGEVTALLEMGTSGIVLRGAPGTGKSWYADQIALAVTEGDRERIFRLQFHPSFTYEDFFDGYVPDEQSKSGFKIEGKTLRKALECAAQTNKTVVLIVDEINRGDTSRIFGETLTYIERGWRDVPFVPKLRTSPMSIPQNLLLLATMNPHDRSITQLDMALLRRFDHVDIPPSGERVHEFLLKAGMAEGHSGEIQRWFQTLQSLLPYGLGHTFFLNVSDMGRLGLVWRYRILPFCEQMLEFEPQKLQDIRQSYDALAVRLRGEAA